MYVLRSLIILVMFFVLQACDQGTSPVENTNENAQIECANGLPAANGVCIEPLPIACPNGVCIEPLSIACPNGVLSENGECLQEAPVCEDGSLPINGECREDHPMCPEDCEFTGGSCTCTVGTDS